MTWRVAYFSKVIKFINKLPINDRSRLKSAIGFLEQHGPNLRMPFTKKIDRNLFELRIKGQDSYRILYTIANGIYCLVHVFKKKSQKIPRKEIKQALDTIKKII